MVPMGIKRFQHSQSLGGGDGDFKSLAYHVPVWLPWQQA